MASQSNNRDAKAEYMTVRHTAEFTVLANREGSIHDDGPVVDHAGVEQLQAALSMSRHSATLYRFSYVVRGRHHCLYDGRGRRSRPLRRGAATLPRHGPCMPARATGSAPCRERVCP